MDIKLIRQTIGEIEAQWLVLGIFEDDRDAPPDHLRESAIADTLQQLIDAKDLNGSLGELTPLFKMRGLAADSVLLVGLGPRNRFDPGVAFTAGLAAAKRLAAKRRESVVIALPPADDKVMVASALIEGAIVGTKGPGIRKSEPNRHPFGGLGLLVDSG